MAEGVDEVGEATEGGDLAGEGVEEVEEDWLGDGVEAFGRGAEAGERGLFVDADGGLVVGDFTDAGGPAMEAEALADFDEDFGGECEEGHGPDGIWRGGGDLEIGLIGVCHCVPTVV